jgi:type IV secretory pathway VirB6-like protein
MKFVIRNKKIKEFKFEVKSSVSVDRLTLSVNFQNLLELNQTLHPKVNLFLMTCSTSLQIYKNYEGPKVFISRIQTELVDSVFRLGEIYFPGFSLMFIPF